MPRVTPINSSKGSLDVAAGFNKDEGRAELEASVAGERGSQAVVSGIATGGSMNISAGRNVAIEGAKLGAGGDAQVAAGCDVTSSDKDDTGTVETSETQEAEGSANLSYSAATQQKGPSVPVAHRVTHFGYLFSVALTGC